MRTQLDLRRSKDPTAAFSLACICIGSGQDTSEMIGSGQDTSEMIGSVLTKNEGWNHKLYPNSSTYINLFCLSICRRVRRY